jgi:hypothetical protein
MENKRIMYDTRKQVKAVVLNPEIKTKTTDK